MSIDANARVGVRFNRLLVLRLDGKDARGRHYAMCLCEQGRNKRTNVFVELDGETHCIAEWEEVTGIHRGTIARRLEAGWSPENALSTPVLPPQVTGAWANGRSPMRAENDANGDVDRAEAMRLLRDGLVSSRRVG